MSNRDDPPKREIAGQAGPLTDDKSKNSLTLEYYLIAKADAISAFVAPPFGDDERVISELINLLDEISGDADSEISEYDEDEGLHEYDYIDQPRVPAGRGLVI